MNWKEDFTVFDTETTGLGDEARILEIGLVRFVSRKVAMRLQFRVDPGPINWDDPQVQRAVEVNGIRKLDVQGLPTFAHIHIMLAQLLHLKVWVAHNMPFDQRMLEQSWPTESLPAPLLKVDTMICDFAVRPSGNSRRLKSLCESWGVENENPHAGLADAEATGQVLIRLMDKLPDKAYKMQEFMKEGIRKWRDEVRGYYREDF